MVRSLNLTWILGLDEIKLNNSSLQSAFMNKFHVIVEITKGSRLRYVYHKGGLKFVGKLPRSLPENYGCILNTLAPDREELDAVIIGPPIKRGRIECRVIGTIMRSDKDDKVICVPVKSGIRNLKQVPHKRIEKIIKTWTGNTGQGKLKCVIGQKETLKLIRKYSK